MDTVALGILGALIVALLGYQMKRADDQGARYTTALLDNTRELGLVRESVQAVGFRVSDVETRLSTVETGQSTVEAGLAELRTHMDERFEQVDRRFERVDRKLDDLSDKLDGHFAAPHPT